MRVIVISEAGPPLSIYPDPMGGFDTVSGVCIAPPLGTGNCPEDSNPPAYTHVFESVGSTNALLVMTQTYPQWQDVLRRGALKYLAVVSDDTDVPADLFLNQLLALDPGPPNMFQDWKFFGVFCTGDPACPTSGGSQVLGIPCVEVGQPYLDLVDMSGGLSGDLCAANQDFAGVFTALAETVIEYKQIACDWAIPPPPKGEIFDATRVNVDYTPSEGAPPERIYFVEDGVSCAMGGEGWFYDDRDNPTRVIACPDTCARISNQPGAQLDVIFGCRTLMTPD